MSEIEVLVACMHQTDDSLYKAMNLQTDVVFANQCNEYSYKEYIQENGRIVKLVSTSDRGVGKNRNTALLNASGKYLLCADEDLIYRDNYESIVFNAFERFPKADIIVFNLEYLNRPAEPRKTENKYSRVRFWNCMRYGAPRMAIRKNAIDKANIWFSTLYGGGAKYSCGEDSLFLREALRKGLKIYYYPKAIATVKQETSTWFNGYTDKFYIDKGVLIANAFPVLKHLLLYYFAFKSRNESKEYSFKRICKLMKQGIKEFNNL